MKKYNKFIHLYIQKHSSNFIIGGFGIFLTLLIALIIPFFARIIIDQIIVDKNYDALLTMVIIIPVILIIGAFINFGTNYLFITIGAKISLDIKSGFFSRILKTPYLITKKRKSGETFYRLNTDTDNVQNFISFHFVNLIVNLLLILIIFLLLLYLHAILALFVIVFIILESFIYIKFYKPIIKYNELLKGKSEKFNGTFIEYLDNLLLLKSFSKENTILQKFNTKLKDLLEIVIKLFKVSYSSKVLIGVVNSFSSFVVLGYGGYLVIEEQLTLGILIQFLLFTNMLAPSLNVLINILLGFPNFKTSFHRFWELHENPIENFSKSSLNKKCKLTGQIEFRNVYFKHKGIDSWIINGLSFKINKGEICSIVGKSGIGKTTLWCLINGIYKADRGKILIDNIDINKYDKRLLRENIGVILQDQFIMAGSIIENLLLGNPNSNMNNCIKACENACIYNFIKKLPLGFHTPLGSEGINLSPGQSQRLAIARLFLQNPPIAVLDEPTSFLDKENEIIVMQNIADFLQSRTAIIISHRAHPLLKTDNIIHLGSNR